uniref:Nudix hydrolase domain-containing protein n=1 Tax=viral metagenome TaxID=1070528 RepID=A0A6C0I2H4_9ZZZZ
MLTKTSIGIILIKPGSIKFPPEVLLVHKRYTYVFSDFVNGNYIYLHHNNNSFFLKKKYTIMSVEALLEQMTTDELLDILSLNFEQMWYRINLSVDKTDPVYIKKYNKFKLEFLHFDNGAKLTSIIKSIRSRGSLLWEVPKGRKSNDIKESDLECAMREIEEETGITKSHYEIIPNVKKKVSYISNNVKYIFIYFVAFTNAKIIKSRNQLNGKIYQSNTIESNDIREVSEIGWFNLQYIKLFDNGSGHLYNIIKPSFAIVKNYLKK